MRDFIEWWAGWSPWVRCGVAAAVLVLATASWLAGAYLGWRFGFRVAVLGWALGVALLIFSLPSGSERKGYHDF